MTDTATTTAPDSPAPAAPEPTFAELVNREVKAQLIRRGLKFNAIESGIGMSHAKAARRSQGENEWTLSEVEQVADWLGLDVVLEFRPRP